jgi:ADP-ribosylglycohydrolase
MRCTPMAVFTAGLTNKDDIIKAILSDVKMTHPHQLVHEAIYIYQLAIHHLLNNINNPDRAQEAFNQALQSSKDLSTYPDEQDNEQSVEIWLKLA